MAPRPFLAAAAAAAAAASPGSTLSGPRRSCMWFILLMMAMMMMMVSSLGSRNQRRRETKEILPASGSTLTPQQREKASTSRSLGPPTRLAGVSCSSVTSARTVRAVCRGRCLRFPLAKSGTLPAEVVVALALVGVEATLETVFRFAPL